MLRQFQFVDVCLNIRTIFKILLFSLLINIKKDALQGNINAAQAQIIHHIVMNKLHYLVHLR